MSSEKPGVEKMGEAAPNETEVYEPMPDSGTPIANSLRGFESEEEYPSGISFILLTVGLMAVVLVLALDNYIICEYQATASYRSDTKADTSKRPPYQLSQPISTISISSAGMAAPIFSRSCRFSLRSANYAPFSLSKQST